MHKNKPVNVAAKSLQMLTQINSSSKVKHRRWQKDSEAKDCPHCQSMFTFLTRKHHCRLCGFVVCGACSRHKSPLPTLGYYKSVRVCDKCVFKHISNKSPEKLTFGHFPKSSTNLTSTLRFNNRKFCLSLINSSQLGIDFSPSVNEIQIFEKPFLILDQRTQRESISAGSSISQGKKRYLSVFDHENPRIWVPDEYAYCCFECNQEFGLVANRRHQ